MSDTPRVSAPPLGYGLLGAGRFGLFSAQQYQQMDEVRVLAVADANPDAARATAAELGVDAVSPDALLANPDIDLVHIATPPFTHSELVHRALAAEKHVLCEKPLATTLADAQAMINLAHTHRRLLTVNLIMRYDPLCEAVEQIVGEELLGKPLHGFFENYAKDEPLPPSHWFWRRDKSGGIFVEHGVHFFDLFRGWLGDGEPVAAQEVQRPGADFIEQVQCTVRYPGDVLVNFYHGFTQAGRMDRQEMRLVFERGELRLFEWVPTSLVIDCLADAAALDRLRVLLPGAKVTVLAEYHGDERRVTSRHKTYRVDGRYRLEADTGMSKPALYGHVLRGLLADQIAAVRDPSHTRRISEANGLESLRTAISADHLAQYTYPPPARAG